MNYLKAYINLVRKASKQSEPKVYEKHHVFPKSVYGKNNYIVKLTPRQHYVAHTLLYKGFVKRYGKSHFKTKKMLYALWCMHSKNLHQSKRYINSRTYQMLREEFRATKVGKNNHNYGKPLSDEVKRKLRLANSGEKSPMYGKTGELNPFYGRNHTEESKKKMREAAKQRPKKVCSEEQKLKISLSKQGHKNHCFGKRCYNNGEKNVFAFEPPEGFILGRLKNHCQ